MQKRKTICLILPGKLPVPNTKGGAIETLLTLLIDQNEIEHKVDFIVVSAWDESAEKKSVNYKNTEFIYFHIRNTLWKKGINCVNYIIARTTGVIDFFSTPMHNDIHKIIRAIKADVVVVEHGIYKNFGFLRRYYDKDQLYLHLHGKGPDIDNSTKKTFGNCILVSEYLKKYYEKQFDGYNTAFHVCLNGISDRDFKRRISTKEKNLLRQKYKINENDLLVLYCGRLIPEKGVKEIIRGIIKTGNPNIKLMVIGGSEFKDSKATRYVRELHDIALGHGNQISFTGYIPNGELYKYYQIAHIQAICSTCEEAAGLVAVEGMMSGLTLMVTNSGGIQEYVNKDNIIAVDKRNALMSKEDSDKLADEIANKLQDEYIQRKYLTKSDKQYECDKFTQKAYYDRFLEIF